MKKQNTILLLLSFFALASFAQSSSKVTRAQLQGMWYTCNRDSLYYKGDTIYFYNDVGYVNCKCPSTIITWNIIKWGIGNVEWTRCNWAAVQPNPCLMKGLKNFRIKTHNGKQFIYLYSARKEEFEMVSIMPNIPRANGVFETKKLTLVRIKQ